MYLGRTGAMDRASARFLSNLAMTVTVPSLYFSRLVESVSPELIVAAWPMLLQGSRNDAASLSQLSCKRPFWSA